MLNTLTFIANHPLTKNHKTGAYLRWLKWQFASRLSSSPIVVPFVNDALLEVTSGMTGATGNIYCGLHEFEDMGFVLHYMRKNELFVDVGANIGSYTILAGKAAGAKVQCFEPVPETYEALCNNINLNQLESTVTASQIGIGSCDSTMEMTASHDTMNHIAVKYTRDEEGATIQVPVKRLDDVLHATPSLCIKIDVEGFETEVIKGAEKTLSNKNCQAIIMELNGSGKRYGYDETELHKKVCEMGFKPHTYNPFQRKFTSLEGNKSKTGNTLYLKNPENAQTRVKVAESFTVIGQRI